MAEAIRRLLEISEDSKLQEYEESRAKYRFDQMSRETDALQEGIEKGLVKGRAEGRQEGRAEGRAEGRQEGRAEGRREVALNMLKAGIDPQVILNSTGLSTEELEDLKKQINYYK